MGYKRKKQLFGEAIVLVFQKGGQSSFPEDIQGQPRQGPEQPDLAVGIPVYCKRVGLADILGSLRTQTIEFWRHEFSHSQTNNTAAHPGETFITVGTQQRYRMNCCQQQHKIPLFLSSQFLMGTAAISDAAALKQKSARSAKEVPRSELTHSVSLTRN